MRLLRCSRGRRALLIERAIPGTDLATLPEEDAASIAVAVALQLWREAGEPFGSLGDHIPDWLEHAEPLSDAGRDLLACAQELYRGLHILNSTLVHGDFHHHNILRAGDRYLAIDPKPCSGSRSSTSLRSSGGRCSAR